MHQSYLQFFNQMELAVYKEFENTEFQAQITNHYAREQKPLMTVNLRLIIPDKQINIIIHIDKNFPRRSKPQIFSQDSYLSDIIDRQTREIRYDSIHDWNTKPKLKILVEQLKQYFTKYPPQQMKELQAINKRFQQIYQKIGNLEMINWASEERNLNETDKQNLYDSKKNYDVIMKTSQVTDIKRDYQKLLEEMQSQVDNINTQETLIKSSLESEEQNYLNYIDKVGLYRNLTSEYKNLEQRFTRQNIWEHLQNLKQIAEQRCEELRRKIEVNGFGDQ